MDCLRCPGKTVSSFFSKKKGESNRESAACVHRQWAAFPAMLGTATDEEHLTCSHASGRPQERAVWWLAVALRLCQGREKARFGSFFLIVFDGPRFWSCLIVFDWVDGWARFWLEFTPCALAVASRKRQLCQVGLLDGTESMGKKAEQPRWHTAADKHYTHCQSGPSPALLLANRQIAPCRSQLSGPLSVPNKNDVDETCLRTDL